MVGVLPGSRAKEVASNLPPLGGAIDVLRRERPDLQLVAALAPTLPRAALEAALAPRGVRIAEGETHAVLSAADVALVASGTATVEAALLQTPMVVVYRLSRLTYHLGKYLVRVPH